MLWQRGISYNSQEYNPSHPSFTEWIRNSVELDQKFWMGKPGSIFSGSL
jgi:hypothetical protein